MVYCHGTLLSEPLLLLLFLLLLLKSLHFLLDPLLFFFLKSLLFLDLTLDFIEWVDPEGLVRVERNLGKD